MVIRFTSIVLLLLLFSSCEEVVELDVDFNPAVVVVSEVSPGREVRVSLNRARPILSQSPTEYVVASEVTITNRRNGRFTELTLQEPTKDTLDPNNQNFPFYSSGQSIIGAENTYELNIKLESKATISAVTTIPKQVDIESLNLIDFSENIDPRDDDNFEITFDLNFNHDSRNAGTYHLIFYFFYTVQLEMESDTVFRDFFQVPTVDDLSMSFPYTLDFQNGVLIKGEDVPEGNNSLEGKLSVNFSKDLSPFPPELWVELRNTNEDYHNYHFNLTRQQSQRDSILSQAILIPSNINNGLGVFSGYNYDFQVVELTD